MRNSSRHAMVSVVSTVSMVVLTVLLAAWSPPQPEPQTTEGTAAVAVAPGQP